MAADVSLCYYQGVHTTLERCILEALLAEYCIVGIRHNTAI